jgi:hypothetical protein
MGLRIPAFVCAALLLAAPARAACPPPAEHIAGAEAAPGGTIRLRDGRVLKLAGVELSDAGRAALTDLVQDQNPLTIRPIGNPDRWNRQTAHIDGLEEALLVRGLGHAAAQIEGACLGPLLEAEAKARALRIGIWANRDFVIAATDGAALTAHLGRHVVAEGRVISARTSRGRVYLNFARYWKTGLSLIIAEKDWPLFAGGAAAENFVGRRLRVRGRLEYRVGPAIIAGPDDRIEVLEP